ncbi:MAG: SHOCT domain-containing protein [Actinomycetota bacterium]
MRALIIAFTLLAVVAIQATWIQRQLLDSDEWVDTSSKLLEDEEIQKAVANFTVDELYANVDVAGVLQDRLPKDFQGLAGPAASGLRELAIEGAQKALATDRIQQAWRDANRVAHGQLVAIVRGESEAVQTGPQGEVVLDLRPLVLEVADTLGLGSLVKDRLPADVGQLRILKESELSLAQDVARAIDGLAIISTLGLLVLLGLALYLSRGYRWLTLVAAGGGLLLAGIFTLLLRELAGNIVTENLASESARPAADAAWSIGTSLLSDIAVTVITYGLLTLGAAWLASSHRSAVATRRALTPALRDYPVVCWAVFAAIAIVYIASGIGNTQMVLTRFGVVVLVGVGVWYLRRFAIAESPDATYDDMGERVRSSVAKLRLRHGATAAPPPEPDDRRLERLARLGELRERGVLTKEEFAAEKAALLAREQ